ncbi:hypothetical protein AABB24_026579 [Solanum stoloniferum]|uniref:GRAM domain-containing protein n=1 Tax=Solanum stoloniferum TaxID=62892 RepID=A0ABD2SFP5_9SOLN
MKKHHIFQEDHQNSSGSSLAMSSSFGTSTPERHSSFSQDSESAASSLHSPSSSDYSPRITPSQDDSAVIIQKRKLGKKAKSYAYRIREHVKLGSKFSETVKGKLKIVKGGRRNIFRHMFNVNDGEKLLKASQCYLYTTAGPIAGIIFISTDKITFCSERPIAVPFPSGGILRTPYKVVIPVPKIKRAHPSVNENKPSQKYIEIVTEDNFEFWFMGFVRYEKAFLNLQKVISMSN